MYSFPFVDPGRIGLPPQQCECRVIPLYYGPERGRDATPLLTDYKETGNNFKRRSLYMVYIKI